MATSVVTSLSSNSSCISPPMTQEDSAIRSGMAAAILVTVTAFSVVYKASSMKLIVLLHQLFWEDFGRVCYRMLASSI